MTDPRMTPTNDAPVTVEHAKAIAEGVVEACAKLEVSTKYDLAERYRWTAVKDDAQEIIEILAALASAPAEPLPDIGPDPFKGPREEDRYEGSRLRLRSAYVQQQKGVPDQTALVWRYDLGTVLEMAIRLKSILADEEEPASAPAGDGDVGLLEAARDLLDAHKRLGGAAEYRADLWDCLERNVERLDRPRAAVGSEYNGGHCTYCDGTGDVHRADGEWLGECPDCKPERAPVGDREAWELPDLRDLHRDIERVRNHDLGNDRMGDLLRGAMDMLKAADVEYAALQSPPAKVEGA